MMLRYFARRNELVRQMFGADTLKDAFDHERSAILAARLKLLVERRERGKSIAGVPSVDGLSAWFEEAAPSTSTSPPPTMRAYVRD